MHRVYYHPGLGGDPICLEGDGAFVGYGGELRSHKWSRNVTGRSVRGMTLGVREVDFDVVAFDAEADALRRACDADVASEKPGTIVVDGEWRMRCYVVESSTGEAYRDHVSLKLKAVLVDPYWWRENNYSFVIGLNENGMDFPFDFPFDFSFSSGSGSVEVESSLGAKPKLTFYGPCTNPYVIIGDNRYEVDYNVVTGCKVVIDATGDTPTVMHYDQYGNGYSVFPYAVRDGGEGGGSYAFERVKAGSSAVTWSGAFAWSLELRELETEPPWDR